MSAELEPIGDRKEKKGKGRRAAEDNAEADVKPKEKKVKKKSKGPGEKVAEDGTAGTESPSRAEKERKRKHHKADVNNEVPDATNDQVGEPSKKKRKKERKVEEHPGAVDVEDKDGGKVHSKVKKSKKSSSERRDERAEEAADSDDSSTVKRKKLTKDKKKKRKKDREENDNALPFFDPSADTELTEKARGALTYVYTRLSSPDSWKFNKAHQIWIVKHLFSPDVIAEKYLPIVAGYLSGCQGGVRENLIQSCNKHLDTKAEPPDSVTFASDAPKEVSSTDIASKGPGQEDVVLSPEMQETVKARARVILKSLGCAPPNS